LQIDLGSLYVNDFNLFGRTFRVTIQAERNARANPTDLSRLYVRNAGGQMIPLALWLRGMQLDVYSEIGLVMLIGLAAKNAILIDDRIKDRYEREPEDRHSCRVLLVCSPPPYVR
jgi:multidrug efflux pump subunit AcrB